MPAKKKAKGGKKKAKKEKRSKEQIAQDKLDKAAEAFQAAQDLHVAFVSRLDKWMLENYGRAIDLFRRFDLDGDGSLTYEEFYAGLRDLNAPVNTVEMYVLARKLDADNNGLIDYLEFSKGLKYYRPEECVPDDGLPTLRIAREQLEYCPCCKLGMWQPYKEKYPRFICLELKLQTFAKLKTYPGNFQVYVHAHVFVYCIEDLIKQRFGDTIGTKVFIMHQNVEGQKVKLDSNFTLQDCGFQGGPRHEPQLLELLYDYQPIVTDCPILMSDHYF